MVWNRLRYVKNPDTGKRVSRLNPSSEWITTDVPHLRIVPDELWSAAKDAADAHSTRDCGDRQARNGEPSALPVLGTDEMR